MKKALAIGLIMIGILSISAIGWMYAKGSQPAQMSSLRPADAEIVALGKTIYAANCAACHGSDLQGEPNWRTPKPDLTMPAPPHDRTGHTWHHTDQVLFDLTKFGLGKFLKNPNYKSNMPAYEGVLNDQEIIAVLSFIKSAWPEEVRARHDKLNAQNTGEK